jgi:hypothetical protein
LGVFSASTTASEASTPAAAGDDEAGVASAVTAGGGADPPARYAPAPAAARHPAAIRLNMTGFVNIWKTPVSARAIAMPGGRLEVNSEMVVLTGFHPN